MSAQSSGVRGWISEPAAQGDDASGTIRYYWTGITLNNGDFLQGGYDDPPSSTCSTKMWFFQRWTRTGGQQQSLIGGCGLVGTHAFQIGWESVSGGVYDWVFRMDNVAKVHAPSPANWGDGTSLVAISEPSSLYGNLPVEPNPFMPTVTYSPAIQFYNCASGCGWGNVPGATVQRYQTVCPPSRVGLAATNNIQTYWGNNGNTCWAVGAHLW